ncbi:epoxide hydrolase [Moniliophthora roreri]|nr:epoxide hydrolase [Moniliophthora roreri]
MSDTNTSIISFPIDFHHELGFQRDGNTSSPQDKHGRNSKSEPLASCLPNEVGGAGWEYQINANGERMRRLRTTSCRSLRGILGRRTRESGINRELRIYHHISEVSKTPGFQSLLGFLVLKTLRREWITHLSLV